MSFGIPVRNGVGVGLLASTSLSTRNRTGFNPAAVLFGAGEPGGWYDPSDLSTMFQDSAGTTPVTATGQTVGLLLDKSQGLVLGPELVTNGTFDSGIADWLPVSGATITYDATNQRLEITNGSFGGAYQNFSVSPNRTYVVTGNYVAGTNATARLVFNYGNFGGSPQQLDVGTGAFRFLATTGAAQTNTRLGLTLLSPTAGLNGFFDNISVKELAGNHLTQATAASRPQYQIDANGLPYLLFDGTDDFLLTGTITPGIDKAQVFAGVRMLQSISFAVLSELSSDVFSNNGAFALLAPRAAAAYGYRSRGTANAETTSAGSYVAPITNVLTGLGDISGDLATLRVNGTQAAQSTADQGTGNYLAYPLYVGRRGGTSLSFNGRLYQLIVRFGANLDAATIAATETYVNSKTGAYV